MTGPNENGAPAAVRGRIARAAFAKLATRAQKNVTGWIYAESQASLTEWMGYESTAGGATAMCKWEAAGLIERHWVVNGEWRTSAWATKGTRIEAARPNAKYLFRVRIVLATPVPVPVPAEQLPFRNVVAVGATSENVRAGTMAVILRHMNPGNAMEILDTVTDAADLRLICFELVKAAGK